MPPFHFNRRPTTACAIIQTYGRQSLEEAQRLYGMRDEMILCGTKEGALKGAGPCPMTPEAMQDASTFTQEGVY